MTDNQLELIPSEDLREELKRRSPDGFVVAWIEKDKVGDDGEVFYSWEGSNLQAVGLCEICKATIIADARVENDDDDDDDDDDEE